MSVSITDFGKLTTGQPVQLVTLKNDKIEVQLLTYAAIIHRIIVPDRKGSPTDVVLGYPTARDYELNTDSMGAAVGRFANRIGGAQFPLYEEIVHVTPNSAGNCLHSGLHGFNHALFTAEVTRGETDSVTMTAHSPAGTDGFPGNFDLEIQYSLVKEGLMIRYSATTDAPTVCNMTNHSYFNLNGHGSGSALGHRISVDADAYLEADENSVPTGRKLPVKGTPMDFTEEKTPGRDINADYPALVQAKGYDQCYIIRDSGLRHAAWHSHGSADHPARHALVHRQLSGTPDSLQGWCPLRSPRCRLLRDRGFPRRPEPSRFPRYDPAAGCPVQLHHDLSVRHRTYVKRNAIQQKTTASAVVFCCIQIDMLYNTYLSELYLRTISIIRPAPDDTTCH